MKDCQFCVPSVFSQLLVIILYTALKDSIERKSAPLRQLEDIRKLRLVQVRGREMEGGVLADGKQSARKN